MDDIMLSQRSTLMIIKQFEDPYLSHFSYAVSATNGIDIMLIDPSRNPEPYLEYASSINARIAYVLLTHSHADFVASHLELAERHGATILVSKHFPAKFQHKTFDDGDQISLDNLQLKALNTPGHSLDSICVLATDQDGTTALFSGDTLFIGDIGRPDLREGLQNLSMTFLAEKMYESLQYKIMPLADEVAVYPSHGAGTLCGKSLEKANSSTIGKERIKNWAFQTKDRAAFVATLTADQPFSPAYFEYAVEANLLGAPAFDASIRNIGNNNTTSDDPAELPLIIDTRDEAEFKRSHQEGAINIMEGEKFETWLGTIIYPTETFSLCAANEDALNRVIRRTASIGYEAHIDRAYIFDTGERSEAGADIKAFQHSPESFTIIDVRNRAEVQAEPLFKQSINIPLPELRQGVGTVPLHKPLMVHCAAGYRSAIASSLLRRALKDTVPIYDLGVAIHKFK